jgi:hypothetical protein
MAELSLDEKFEDAVNVRDKYAHLNRAASRIERLNSIAKLPELIVAKPIDNHWEFIRKIRTLGCHKYINCHHINCYCN